MKAMHSVRRRVRTFSRRLAYRLRRHLLRSDFLVARERRFGLRFRFKTEDAIGRRIYQSGAYEEPLTRFLLRGLELREGDAIVDAGANIGWFSILLDHVAPDDVAIYAFEPDPLNFELLTGNLDRNSTTAVVPIRTALADREGRRLLHLYPNKNRGRHSFGEIPGGAGTVEVRTTTLERFWRDREMGGRTLRLLKVDVEGFERSVLVGAGRLLERCHMVATEYAPELLRRSGCEPRRLLELLSGFGFEPHRPVEGELERLEPAALERRNEPVNLVWTRRGSGAAGSGS